MAMNVIENVRGIARVNWVGASILFIGLYVACGLIPAAGMWWFFGDSRSISIALAVGFSMACCSFPMLLIQQLRMPIDRLPMRK